MNYLKIYINLCKRGKLRLSSEKDQIYEKHHVFPVSIFGKNKFTVKLTAREHYIAHKLLIKICIKRYGLKHEYSRKMLLAVHKMVYRLRNSEKLILRSIDYEIARSCVRNAKIGKKRNDMIGKRYFGASEDNIKNGLKTMAKKKLGKKINYPKIRKSRGAQSESTKDSISKKRLQTLEKYVNMSNEEFIFWVQKQNLFMKDGRKNSNVTRAIIARKEKLETYYNHD